MYTSKAKVAGSNLTPEVSNPLLSVKLYSKREVLSMEFIETAWPVEAIIVLAVVASVNWAPPFPIIPPFISNEPVTWVGLFNEIGALL